MRDRRFLLNCVLICLPAVALCAFGVYFSVAEVPRIERDERRRTTLEYRPFAEELAEFPSNATVRAAYDPARHETERGVRTRDGRLIPWGYGPAGDGQLVWIRDGETVLGTVVETVGIPDIGVKLRWGVGVLLFLFAGITVCCLRFFLLFARERDDFLAATAHDLTTPLAGMRYLIGRSDEDVRNLTERMIRLVENIKDFLKLGGRRAKPKCEAFPVGEAFDEAYRVFAADYEEEPSGPVEVSGDRSLRVFADRTLTVQILWNLLGNDLKYAAPDGAVRVRFARDGGYVRIAFADEGQGMTPKQMKLAFDRYYRARTVLASGKGGFGIGLCTAREFAKRMGGSLSVAPNVPRGCVFTLSLPAAPHGVSPGGSV